MTNDPEMACATPPEEMARIARECWDTECSRRALVRDWAGWRWCLRHFWEHFRQGGDYRWQQLRWARPYWGRR